MIRRLDASTAGLRWVLISQREHARVSGQLAAACAAHSSPWPPEVRDEVLVAVARHDDGWPPWDAAPRMDPQRGCPLSFTELPADDALSIWSRSIDAAAEAGPLAAWLVAGHFARLVDKHAPAEPSSPTGAWRAQIDRRRHAWLAAWTAADPAHRTRAAADEALQWLWTFDEASLWLCATSDEAPTVPAAPEPHVAGRGTPVAVALAAAGQGGATVDPWRFAGASLDVSIEGLAVAAQPYADWSHLQNAAHPCRLDWRLRPATGR